MTEAFAGRRRAGLAAAALLLAGCAPEPGPGPAAPERRTPAARAEAELRDVAERHFAAIGARDLDALLATVTGGERLTLILPDGARHETRAGYADLHRDWFAGEGDWTMEHEVLRVVPGRDLGLVLVRTTMLDGTPRSGRQALLTLAFAREGEAGWRLVFDQNTAIATHPPRATAEPSRPSARETP